MAIQFPCQRCCRMLGIASRKAGSQIECPHCGLLQTVPSEEAAQASMTLTQLTANPLDSVKEVVVYDEEPADIGMTQTDDSGESDSESATDSHHRVESAPSKVPPKVPMQSSPSLSKQAMDTPLPSGMILFPRRTLYLQALLYLVVLALGFGLGYFIGRGDASYDLKVASEEASKKPVLIEGKLMWEPVINQLAGEEGAVVIALPVGELPERTFSISGLRPQDPPPSPINQNVRQIEEFGGIYRRADPDGAFSILIPKQGKYQFLLIARHATRPKDQPIDELDLSQIQQYFLRAEDLISRYKYRWSLEECLPGTKSIEFNFGIDRKDEKSIDLGL